MRRDATMTRAALQQGKIMTLSDAILILLLAERIHGTDVAVRKAAKNVVKKLPRAKRDVIWDIIDSKRPREVAQYIAANLD